MSAATYLADRIVDSAPPAKSPAEPWAAWRRRVRDTIARIESDTVLEVAYEQGWCRKCDGAGEVKTCRHGTANCPCAWRPCPECRGGDA